MSIGEWVLREACRQMRAWKDAGLPSVRMAVNVSAVQFMGDDFLSVVRDVLVETGVQPHHLELELTETVLMRDADSAIETLNALKSIGVQLAVDDFGTGYSSFSYLRRFPLDALKVDRSFINEISPDSDNATILSALINIGKSLNYRVVAEGVETRSNCTFCRSRAAPKARAIISAVRSARRNAPNSWKPASGKWSFTSPPAHQLRGGCRLTTSPASSEGAQFSPRNLFPAQQFAHLPVFD